LVFSSLALYFVFYFPPFGPGFSRLVEVAFVGYCACPGIWRLCNVSTAIVVFARAFGFPQLQGKVALSVAERHTVGAFTIYNSDCITEHLQLPFN